MHLVVIVLNKTEVLSKLLAAFMDAGISGATVLDSKGMLSVIGHSTGEEIPPLFNSLRSFLRLDEESNKTIFAVVKEENIKKISEITNKITGGLDKPNTGILFSLPIGYIEGLPKK